MPLIYMIWWRVVVRLDQLGVGVRPRARRPPGVISSRINDDQRGCKARLYPEIVEQKVPPATLGDSSLRRLPCPPFQIEQEEGVQDVYAFSGIDHGSIAGSSPAISYITHVAERSGHQL